MKTEVYYQSLYNVPVNTFSSSYSMLNTGAGFKTDLEDSLVNNGTGTNYGIELTLEKFFSRGYYGLFTSSIYSSKYKGSDGVERNTAFNGKYVFNILGGKEWKVGSEKQNKISADIKCTNAGEGLTPLLIWRLRLPQAANNYLPMPIRIFMPITSVWISSSVIRTTAGRKNFRSRFPLTCKTSRTMIMFSHKAMMTEAGR
ncbi:MAG: hypothetical protein IPH45_04685 [Bacteroidales bacterium]|nr:hypothetical protein [Bacteroidales bacterium]